MLNPFGFCEISGHVQVILMEGANILHVGGGFIFFRILLDIVI